MHTRTQVLPGARFVLPLAPTVSLEQLAGYADPRSNPLIGQLGWGGGGVVTAVTRSPWSNSTKLGDGLEGVVGWLESAGGARVALWGAWPAYDLYLRCELALTTVGTNTAELGALGVPMVRVGACLSFSLSTFYLPVSSSAPFHDFCGLPDSRSSLSDL